MVSEQSGSPPILLFESLEGDASTQWPVSPPLQDCQQLPSVPDVILATGMAANTHWSIALETNPKNNVGDDAAQATIVWDVACRMPNERSEQLGSSYRLNPQASTTQSDKHVLIQYSSFQYCLAVVATDQKASPPKIEVLESEKDSGFGHTIRIGPAEIPHQLPQTVRSKYQLNPQPS